ncbi:MAG: cell division protein FtsZ [Hyphomicrobiaceae bacterium]|nr:cell division protein FtsZ [Hyphomicrobiaceae bacterium]
MSIKLQLPTLTDLRPRITVIGVGGAGCNAVNNMIAAGLSGVEFVVANTDAQALTASSAEHRLQLGINLTEGLGAGSKPEIGEAAAEEAIDEIRAQISGSHMLFIAAGMGGGTGTGACAVIARIAQELGILTVGVVTKPFMFEGTRRQRMAEAGIGELRKHVDTLIVIPNQNLFRIANERTTFAEAFVLADQVLYSGVACIVDLILKDGLINLDFADVRTVMRGMGAAMMGTGEASGERRAVIAAEEAIANPLLDDVSLKGARGLLLSITGSHDMTLYEVDEAASRVRQEVDPEANIIVGATFDDSLADSLRVSIVASGMAREQEAQKPPRVVDANAWPAVKLTPDQAPVQPPPLEGYSEPRSAGAATQAPQSASSFESQLAGAIATGKSGGPTGASAPDRGTSGGWSGGRESWQAPGNVRIDAGYQPQAGAAMPPPVPPAPHGGAPYPGEVGGAKGADGFRPQPPVDVRRTARRMPEVDDFPPVGQREYYARTGAEAPRAVAPAGSVQQAQGGQPRRPGLFERIAGMGRRAADSAGIDPVSPQNGRAPAASDGRGAAPRVDGPPSNALGSAPTATQEGVELPMFFSKSRK